MVSDRSKAILRLAYVCMVAVSSIIVGVSGNAKHLKELSDRFYQALNAVDPFIIIQDKDIGHILQRLAHADALSWIILLISVAVIFKVFHMYPYTGDDASLFNTFGRFWSSVVLSFIIAAPLKWSLMLLTAMFGAGIGFMTWINGITIGVLEVFIRFNDFKRGAAEIKNAVVDMAKELKKPKEPV